MTTQRGSAAIYFFILSGIGLITAWYFNAPQNMKNLWLYVVLGFITAAAFTVPLFLGMRELKLKREREAGNLAKKAGGRSSILSSKTTGLRCSCQTTWQPILRC